MSEKKIRGKKGSVTIIGMTPEKAIEMQRYVTELLYKQMGYNVTVTAVRANE